MSESDKKEVPPVIDPAPQPGRGGKVVLVVILLVLGGLFLIGNWFLNSMGEIATSFAQPGGTRYTEVTMRSGDSSQRIIVIPVNGIISSYGSMGDSMVTQVKKQLDFAAKDDRVKAVLLKIDSPGGEVLASDEIARAIREFQKETKKPVIASMGGMAASGGYYIAAPCKYIIANELTITGSIGVIMQSVNVRGLMDKVGVEPITFTSGKNKAMLDPFNSPEKVTDEQKKILQDFIDGTHDKFVAVVETGRDKAARGNGSQAKALVKDWQDYADGRILTGEDALKHGMVDANGNFDDAIKFVEKIVKISEGDARLVRNDPPVTFGGLFRLLGKAEATEPGTTVKLDLGLDIPKLRAGVPYYLSPHLFSK